jgi:hypothetical protein
VNETKELLRRGVGDFEPTTDSFDRVLARRDRKHRNQRVAAGVLGIAVFAIAAIGLVRLLGSEGTPAGDPRSPFLGTWELFAHGSQHTLEIQVSGDGVYELALFDEGATVCDGLPARETGVGTLASSTEMTVTSQVITCEDGTVLEDVPPITYTYDSGTDTLSDSSGEVWHRPGSDPDVTPSGVMWPQTSLEEVRQAQELADADDPRYAWQIDPDLAAMTNGDDAQIVTRFLREELGWEEFRSSVGGQGGEYGEGTFESVFIRCAPGRTNPLYPNDPAGRGCAPTIDQFRYETVKIKVAQLGVQGPSGIWVVARWEMLPASDEPMTYALLALTQRQIEQVAPPSDAEATALLEAFLQARVEGEGAEEYLSTPSGEFPLPYATTSGASYERSEFELVQGPVWPTGRMEFEVRLFADGGKTVVEQPFVLDRAAGGSLGLSFYSLEEFPVVTTENGEPVSVPYEFLDGEVTFRAAPPWDWSVAGWEFTPKMATLNHPDFEERLVLVADPLPVETGCEDGPAPADAEALARSIRSDPDLEATEPVVVSVGGIDALRMDVVAATGASVCEAVPAAQVVAPPPSAGPNGDLGFSGANLDQGHRMRLYLLDLPGGPARMLAIAIIAPDARFEHAVEAAAPIMASIELRTR